MQPTKWGWIWAEKIVHSNPESTNQCRGRTNRVFDTYIIFFHLQDCVIYADAALLGSRSGYITAQGRDAPTETSGFVFKQCTITGTGTSYLGRAYGNHSSVIFYQSKMDKVIVPAGWSAWDHAGQE